MTEAPASFSYPSGHVVGTTVLFVLAFVFAPRLSQRREVVIAVRAISVFMVAVIGVARIWSGAHWPTDVLGGYLLALVFLIPGLAVHRHLQARGQR